MNQLKDMRVAMVEEGGGEEEGTKEGGTKEKKGLEGLKRWLSTHAVARNHL